MQSVMILGAGPLQVPAIKKIKELGMRAIVCDYNPDAVGFSLADEKLIVSTIDNEGVLEQAQKFQPEYILTSTSDAPVKTVAYVCEKLGLPLDISYEDSICATDKSAMRERLKKNHVPIPEFFLCHDIDEFVKAVNQIKEDKCIVKPADNAASRGVKLVDKTQNKNLLEEQYNYSKSYSRNGIVLVEEFMRGEEVSVECIIENKKVEIITITDKLVSELPYFVELGHSEPSMLPEEVQKEIHEITKRTISAIGIINGTAHVEMKVTNDGPKVVEIAARLGGDYITSRLVPISTGIDMVGNSVLLALHRPINVGRTRNMGSAIRFFSGKEGILKEIKVNKDVNKMPGFKEIEFYVKPGEKIRRLQSSNDRLGHIITEGTSAEEAIHYAEGIMKEIEFIVE